MSDDTLFFKYDLSAIIENQRKELVRELDGMSDDRLLNTTVGQLEMYCGEKYRIDLPVLGVPQVDQRRTKMTVGRYGQDFGYGFSEGGVEVDAEQFTLEVPYTGDEILFWTRGNQWNSMPPRGSVNPRFVSTSIRLREPDADKINQAFEGCCQTNTHSSPIGRAVSLRGMPQLNSSCHSASAAERRSL